MPMGSAIARLTRYATPTTASVLGMRSLISSHTGIRLPKEKHQSPWDSAISHLTYRTGHGWSSPSERRMLSRTSGGTAGFAANCDSGSPGASDNTAYRTKLIISRVGIARRSRRTRYLLICSYGCFRSVLRAGGAPPPSPLRGGGAPPLYPAFVAPARLLAQSFAG